MMKKALLLTLLFLLLSGCATPRRIDLSYVPQSGVSTLPGANNVILSVQVNDQRKIGSNKVSSKIYRYEETSIVLANEDVTVTIRQAIEDELKSRGFSIGKEAFVLISADLTKFWNDYQEGLLSANAVATLDMTVSVKNKSGGTLFTRIIFAKGVEPIILSSGENARLALNRALENGMKLLFNDQKFLATLIEASKRIPPSQ